MDLTLFVTERLWCAVRHLLLATPGGVSDVPSDLLRTFLVCSLIVALRRETLGDHFVVHFVCWVGGCVCSRGACRFDHVVSTV